MEGKLTPNSGASALQQLKLPIGFGRSGRSAASLQHRVGKGTHVGAALPGGAPSKAKATGVTETAEARTAEKPQGQDFMALLQTAMLSADNDSDDDDDNVEALNAMLHQAVASRKEEAHAKQHAILQEVQTAVDNNMAKLASAIKKEIQESSKACSSKFGDVTAALEKKMAQIQEATSKFHAEAQRLWEEYNGVHAQVEPLHKDIMSTVERKRSGLKRKLEDINKDNERLLQEAEQKLAAVKKSCTKLPGGWAKMLQQLM